ncbi:MAG TPA: nickel pincer cofactor biosynthesis protein LarB, partial [Gemmatimonadaceae bacterium]|nr:nickel pincer cofactor biosynthesis protein LarB [Gemmatimonadaceae bacterium]
PERALDDLDKAPFESLDFATIDHHRAQRQGFPEVIYGEGKTTLQIVAIAERIAERHGGFLATRLSDDARIALANRFHDIEINDLGRTACLATAEKPPAGRGEVLIVTAGTSDLPVAEEAAVTSRALGNQTGRLTDVGVAGIHRLLAKKDELFNAAVIVVVAGMDGALASVVGGLVRIPVIAVPTSVGYGAAFGGIAPLLTMLNSCAAGVTVVNIDNGFGAAVAASRINHS